MNGSIKRLTRKAVLQFLFINIGILIFAVGLHFFTTPNGFAIGGIGGLSIVLAKLTAPLGFGSQATYMAIINVFLLILGVIILGKKCGFLTIYCSLVLSATTWIFEKFLPIENLIDPERLKTLEALGRNITLTDEPLLELVFVIMCLSIGSAILFHCEASSGGTDIIALIMRKYTSINVSLALLYTDALIVLSTYFVYSVEVGLFATLGLFAKTFVVEDLMNTLNMCKAFTIITTKPEKICSCIINEIQHGATIYDAKGVYTGEQRSVIVTVCKRSETARLRRRVKEIDPDSFVILTKTSEITGKGFMHTNQ